MKLPETKPLMFEPVKIADLLEPGPILAKDAANGPLNPDPYPYCKRALTCVDFEDGKHAFPCKNRSCDVLARLLRIEVDMNAARMTRVERDGISQ